MLVKDQIRTEQPKLLDLCNRLGIAGLRVRVDADRWNEVTFIGDIDASRLEGYADRFFGLEEGLVTIFHRRVRLLDESMAKKELARQKTSGPTHAQDFELLHAS